MNHWWIGASFYWLTTTVHICPQLCIQWWHIGSLNLAPVGVSTSQKLANAMNRDSVSLKSWSVGLGKVIPPFLPPSIWVCELNSPFLLWETLWLLSKGLSRFSIPTPFAYFSYVMISKSLTTLADCSRQMASLWSVSLSNGSFWKETLSSRCVVDSVSWWATEHNKLGAMRHLKGEDSCTRQSNTFKRIHFRGETVCHSCLSHTAAIMEWWYIQVLGSSVKLIYCVTLSN